MSGFTIETWAKHQRNFTYIDSVDDGFCSADSDEDDDIPSSYFEKRQGSLNRLKMEQRLPSNSTTLSFTDKILPVTSKLVHGYKTFKIMVLGASNVGKTCLLKRFVHDKFTNDHLPTIADTYETGIFLDINNQLKQFDLELNDFSGDLKYDFPEIYEEKILKSDGFIVIYSKEEPDSLAKVVEIVADINKVREAPVVMVLENKCDLIKKKSNKIRTQFQIVDTRHMEVSAKRNTGIQEAITTLIYDLEYNIKIGEQNKKDTMFGFFENFFLY